MWAQNLVADLFRLVWTPKSKHHYDIVHFGSESALICFGASPRHHTMEILSTLQTKITPMSNNYMGIWSHNQNILKRKNCLKTKNLQILAWAMSFTHLPQVQFDYANVLFGTWISRMIEGKLTSVFSMPLVVFKKMSNNRWWNHITNIFHVIRSVYLKERSSEYV